MKAAAMILIVALCGLSLAPATGTQAAGANGTTGPEQPSEWGINATAWLVSVPYGAAKVAYAVVGGTVGVLTFAFSGGDKDAAMAVWTPSLGGTYIITPDHLRGREPVRFLGGPSDETTPPASAAAK